MRLIGHQALGPGPWHRMAVPGGAGLLWPSNYPSVGAVLFSCGGMTWGVPMEVSKSGRALRSKQREGLDLLHSAADFE